MMEMMQHMIGESMMGGSAPEGAGKK